MDVTEQMVSAFKQAWHTADGEGLEGGRVKAGLTAALAQLQVIEQGTYCSGCDWYESEEDFEGGSCRGCGCPQNAHGDAEIVQQL